MQKEYRCHRQCLEKVRLVDGTATEIVWLVIVIQNNLGKSVLDGVVTSSVFVFMATNKNMM